MPAIIRTVCCGDKHAFAVAEGGRLYGWGANNCGQLGMGHRTAARSPALVGPWSSTEGGHVAIVHVAVGDTHSLACSDDGERATAAGQTYMWRNSSWPNLAAGQTYM